MSDSTPAPGWYPDPADPAGHRYWDGSTWTTHVAPAASAWGAATPAAGTADFGTHAAYAPQTTELTGSGMRHVPSLFDDVGRIIKRAWLPILGISLLLWFGWLVVAVVAVLSLVDIQRLSTAFSLVFDASQKYPGGTWPRGLQDQIQEAFTSAPRTDSPWPYVAVGAVLLVMSILVACVQVAAVNRLGMDAASGQPVSWRTAWRAGFAGGARLFGYALLLTLLGSVAIGVLVGLVVALTAASTSLAWLAALIVTIAVLAWIVVAVWLTGRLIPITAQVDMGPGALRWTWHATRGKFWAVLGRYLLWSIVASIAAQIVLTVVLLPFSVLSAVAAANPTPGTFAWLMAFYAVSFPLTMAVSALTYVGVVPIWRDLTDDPTYRSIDQDGHVVAPTA